MATKKKSKKPTKLKKKTAIKKSAPKKKAAPKKSAKTKAPSKKAAASAKAAAKKKPVKKLAGPAAKSTRGKTQETNYRRATYPDKVSRSAGQSGSLQGLSDVESADSESVEELLEEGNTFEAEVIKGVEDAPDEEEVHTHEVPEDDVPGEYDDQ